MKNKQIWLRYLYCAYLSASRLQAGPTLCTYLHGQAKLRRVSVVVTTTIMEDNTTDQNTVLLQGV